MTNTNNAAANLSEINAARAAVQVAAKICLNAGLEVQLVQDCLTIVMAYHTGRADFGMLESARVASESASMDRRLPASQRRAMAAVSSCCQVNARRAAAEVKQYAR